MCLFKFYWTPVAFVLFIFMLVLPWFCVAAVSRRIKIYILHLLWPIEEGKYREKRVCLSTGLSQRPHTQTSPNSLACCRWPWLCLPAAVGFVMYFYACQLNDDTLFHRVLSCSNHVLHCLLPDKRNHVYQLRSRPHDCTLILPMTIQETLYLGSFIVTFIDLWQYFLSYLIV